MKQKSVEMVMLFDFYGNLLTERQRELFDLYYNEDLSLAEISEIVGITRQGVRDIIVRAEMILTSTEEHLGFFKRFGNLTDKCRKIAENASHIYTLNTKYYSNPEISKCIRNIAEIVHEMAQVDAQED